MSHDQPVSPPCLTVDLIFVVNYLHIVPHNLVPFLFLTGANAFFSAYSAPPQNKWNIGTLVEVSPFSFLFFYNPNVIQ